MSLYPAINHAASRALSPHPLIADVSLFTCSHSGECIVVSPFGFNLHFLDDSDIEHFFMCLLAIRVSILFNSSDLLTILNWVVCLSIVELSQFFVYPV